MAGVDYVRFLPGRWRNGCASLTLEQEGLYVRICAFRWDTGSRVPSDRTTAARIMRININKYRKILNELVAIGYVEDHGDGLVVERAEIEYQKAAAACGEVRRATASGKASRQAPAQPVRTARANPVVDPQHETNCADNSNAEKASTPPLTPPPTHTLTPPQTPPVEAEKTECFLRATKEKEKEKEKNRPPLPPKRGASPSSIEGLKAFEAYNALALRIGLPQASKLTPDRRRKIQARLREYGMDGWDRALANIEKSSFLRGRTGRDFRADLDFVCQAKSFGKLHDGGYGNGASYPTPAGPRIQIREEPWMAEAREAMR